MHKKNFLHGKSKQEKPQDFVEYQLISLLEKYEYKTYKACLQTHSQLNIMRFILYSCTALFCSPIKNPHDPHLFCLFDITH
jgi:hypothetical protein